ncbi:MAG: hypothetical protein OEZ25_09210 [Candidatus Bathyarchaeota archaeon]|nr:hypothetical protein [Candidatus Bathyarchaeota archaeon]
MEAWMVWALIVMVSLVGACGNILWKLASNTIGQISWEKLFDIAWDIKTLFTPLVFTALFLMFLGRFASIVPVGYMGATQLATFVTILTLVFTAVLDALFLKAKYPVEVWVGVAVGLLAIYFISRGI